DVDVPVPGRGITASTIEPVREGDKVSMDAWRAAVAAAWKGHAVLDERPAFVDIVVGEQRSLKGALKPAIDGLEPAFGRELSSRYPFAPRDHIVTWLRVRRVLQQPRLSVTAGAID